MEPLTAPVGELDFTVKPSVSLVLQCLKGTSAFPVGTHFDARQIRLAEQQPRMRRKALWQILRVTGLHQRDEANNKPNPNVPAIHACVYLGLNGAVKNLTGPTEELGFVVARWERNCRIQV